MQKGKTRFGRLWRGTLQAIGLSVLVLGIVAGRCRAIPGLPPWLAARGGAAEPDERIGALDALLRGRYAGFMTSCSCPYGIADLRAYDALLCIRAARWGLSAEWEALRHQDYASDRLAASIGFDTLLPLLSFSLEPSIQRIGVSGYPGQYERRIIGTALLCWGSFGLAVSRSITGDQGGRQPTAWGFSAGDEAAMIVLNGDMDGRRWTGLRAGFRAALSPSIMMMAGFRFETDEISFGLASTWARIIVVLSWSHHPVAGQTAALGVGRVWLR
jgi:hypothetical protein